MAAGLSEVRFDLNSLDDKINKYDKTLNWPMTKNHVTTKPKPLHVSEIDKCIPL